jgi:hypothetical protein
VAFISLVVVVVVVDEHAGGREFWPDGLSAGSRMGPCRDQDAPQCPPMASPSLLLLRTQFTYMPNDEDDLLYYNQPSAEILYRYYYYYYKIVSNLLLYMLNFCFASQLFDYHQQPNWQQ